MILEEQPRTNKHHDALQLVARHRASDVAVSFLVEELEMLPKIEKFSPEARKTKREMINMRFLSLQAELSLTDLVEKMDENELFLTFFDMFDITGNGLLAKEEIASFLSKMDETELFSDSEALKAAEMSMLAFDDDHSGFLDRDEFTDFVNAVCSDARCSPEDFSRHVILRAVEHDSGERVLNETLIYRRDSIGDSISKIIAKHVHNSAEAVCRFIEARIILIFQLLDYKKNSLVDIQDIEHSLSLGLKGMDRQFRIALFRNHNARLDLKDFVKLLFNVCAASSGESNVDIDTICNAMTLVLCDPQNISSHSKLTRESFSLHDAGDMDRSLINNLNFEESTHSRQSFDHLESLNEDQISHLFDLWDLDGNGELDFQEFFLGWRKLHGESIRLEESFGEFVEAFKRFNAVEGDNDSSRKMSKYHFADLLAWFADKTGTSIDSIVEYMLIQTAMKSTKQYEREFIEDNVPRALAMMKEHKKSISKSDIKGMIPDEAIQNDFAEFLKETMDLSESYGVKKSVHVADEKEAKTVESSRSEDPSVNKTKTACTKTACTKTACTKTACATHAFWNMVSQLDAETVETKASNRHSDPPKDAHNKTPDVPSRHNDRSNNTLGKSLLKQTFDALSNERVSEGPEIAKKGYRRANSAV